MVGVREIPSMMCLGLITVSFFVTGRSMEYEGRGDGRQTERLFEEATTGIESF